VRIGRRPGHDEGVISLRRPWLVALGLAPVLGEWLSAATPPLDMLWPPTLLFFVSLYGCGAVLCRELARRHRLGLTGLCLLAAAYAVFEEAIVDRYWFDARPSTDGGLGHYSEVWHTNVLLATNLTIFHVVVSIGSTIVLVELLFPGHRDKPWLSTRGLWLAGAALLIVPAAIFGRYDLRPLPQMLVAAALVLLLVLLALNRAGHPSLWESAAVPRPPRRGLAPVAFLAAGANLLLMGLSDTATPWPLAWLAVVAPVVLAGVFVRRRASGPVFGRDGLRVVTGVLCFYALFAAGVGLTGRPDLTVGAVAVLALLRLVRGRVRSPSSPPPALASP
jgi:hypothetical protein